MLSAKNGFQTDMKMYKFPDFRCLKPNYSIPSSKWSHYEMVGYRAAKSLKDLEEVKEIPFDKYFFNFEDPIVWKEMTDSKIGLDLWKKTYGFDFGAFTEGLNGKANSSKCQQHCLEAEYGTFARKCAQSGGFFKCCVLGYCVIRTTNYQTFICFSLRMDKFELIRYGLKKWRLTTDGPSFEERKCEKSWTTDNCYACFATHICAKRVTTRFKRFSV